MEGEQRAMVVNAAIDRFAGRWLTISPVLSHNSVAARHSGAASFVVWYAIKKRAPTISVHPRVIMNSLASGIAILVSAPRNVIACGVAA
jgi:hypothetical protein